MTPTLPRGSLSGREALSLLSAVPFAPLAETAPQSWGDGRKGQLGVGELPVINFKTHTPRAMSYVPFPERSRATASSSGGNRRHL